jgi:hypothetical protein
VVEGLDLAGCEMLLKALHASDLARIAHVLNPAATRTWRLGTAIGFQDGQVRCLFARAEGVPTFDALFALEKQDQCTLQRHDLLIAIDTIAAQIPSRTGTVRLELSSGPQGPLTFVADVPGGEARAICLATRTAADGQYPLRTARVQLEALKTVDGRPATDSITLGWHGHMLSFVSEAEGCRTATFIVTERA